MGAWIETTVREQTIHNQQVAPYVGAWIETIPNLIVNIKAMSHPTWVRGLKQTIIVESLPRNMSHPTWVRGLKPSGEPGKANPQGRTLRGCVD